MLKTTVLGEMERGEKPIHTLCFVLKFSPSEFISSDAMSKLRQVQYPVLYVYFMNRINKAIIKILLFEKACLVS